MQKTGRSGSHVAVGDRVRVRSQAWRVDDVRMCDACEVVTLSGVGQANEGRQQRILTPFDRVESVSRFRRLRAVRAPTWRRRCRAALLDDEALGTLTALRRASIDLLPYQLEPVLAVLGGEGSRVLIADEVGLGKTIQAGLIVSELIARGAASRILVLCPAGLREQWQTELATRFHLPTALVDMARIRRTQAELPPGVNPWALEPMAIASLDYVKRAEVLLSVSSISWDIVIVDEAHHAASRSDRHAAVASLCAAASHVVLLTATPHNGSTEAFAALCGLGAHGDELLIFRRTRHELGIDRVRRVHQFSVRPNASERRMHALLSLFERTVAREQGRQHPEIALAFATLRKRACSSPFALEQSVRRRLLALRSPSEADAVQLPLPLDAAGEFDDADAVPPWTVPMLKDAERERALLTQLADAAMLAMPGETKLSALKRLLRRAREPVLIFTEYRDTLLHVRDQVAPDAFVIHGGMSRDERRTALDRFSRGGVLLATDAAGEGLNLHHACRIVVNLELPWNPIRLEQRIGRVDRLGQRRRVHVFHFIAHGTQEARVLERLDARVARASAEVGMANPLSDGSSEQIPSAPDRHHMKADAQDEFRRQLGFRQLAERRKAVPDRAAAWSCGPWLLRARRRSTRTQLRGRTLVIFQSRLIDTVGRSIASHLTAVLMSWHGERKALLATLDELALSLIDPSLADWERTTRLRHLSYWRVRIDREQSIMAALSGSPTPASLQPGLFDMRAAHDRQSDDDDHARRTDDAERRLVAMAQRSQLTLQRLQPILVLEP